MKNAKSVIGLISMVVLDVSVATVEYDMVTRFGILFTLVSVFGLLVLLSALFRAPKGYEDDTGFQIGALADAAPA